MHGFSQSKSRRLIVISIATAACLFTTLIALNVYQSYRAIENQAYDRAATAMLSLERSIGRVFETGLGIDLFGTDGRLLVHWPGPVAGSGGGFTGPMPSGEVRAGSLGGPGAISALDGLDRSMARSQVGNLPIVVAVGAPRLQVLQDWLASVFPSLALLVLLGLALAMYGAGRRLQWRLRGSAERLAIQSDADPAVLIGQLKALVEHSADGLQIVEVMEDGRFAWELVSPAFGRLYGRPLQNFSGLDPAACLPPATAEHILSCWRECVATRRMATFPYRVEIEGGVRDLEKIVAPVFDGHGRVVRLVGSIRDVTRRNQTEASLRQSQTMEVVGQLTAGVAHDFDNLLQAVIGGLDMLEGHVGESSEAQQCMFVARRAAFRGAALTNRLLTVSRQQELDPALLDMTEVFDEIGQFCESTLGPHVIVTTSVEPGVWPILADGPQFTTCLINLALNARDAMPGGGKVHVSARNHADGGDGTPATLSGDFVVIEVVDHGMGMRADVLARACDPFFTTKSVGKGSGSGLGLGLAMVQGFTAQSGGAMIIASEYGKGTTVQIWLPRAVGLCAAPVLLPPLALGQGGHVLLVDDDTEMRAVLKVMVGRGGYAVTCVDSAYAALSLLRSGARFDALLTEYAMPNMSGARLIAQVAGIVPDLPALLITGCNQAATSDDDLPVGIRILRKPIRQHDLILQIEAAMNTSRRKYARAGRPGLLPDNVVQLPARAVF